MRLKDYVKREKISEAQLANEIGCTHSMISKIITGARAPSVLLARAIEKYTDGEVSVSELLEFRPEKIPCPCCRKLINPKTLEKMLRNNARKNIR